MLNDIIQKITEYSNQNQIIAGAISLWGLGVLSYLARNVPNTIKKFFIRQFTTKLSIISTHEAYFQLLRWFNSNGLDKNLRSMKITNGRWGDDEEAIKSIGYGRHFMFYKKRLFLVELEVKEAQGSSREMDILTLTTIGRSQTPYNNIFHDIKTKNSSSNNLKIRKYNDNYWEISTPQPKRFFNSVFISDEDQKNIITHIQNFIDREEWYSYHGLPYQTGILLYGPPGTGKTSIIKAVSSHFNRELFILPASRLAKIERAFFNLPNKSIVVIEDIDTDLSVLIRKNNNNDDEPEENDTPSIIEELLSKGAGIGDILNAIDGIITCHGRIMIGTTNNINKIDPAILRDGRFDLKLKIGYANKSIIEKFYNSYFPDFILPEKFCIKNKLTPAEIQGFILKNIDNPDKVLQLIEDKNE